MVLGKGVGLTRALQSCTALEELKEKASSREGVSALISNSVQLHKRIEGRG